MSGLKQNNSRRFREWRRKALLIPAAGLVCLLAVQSAAAQTGTITGVVTDAVTGQTLESALVRLDGAESGVLSNTSGRYIITGVSTGSHQVTFTILGYEEHTVDVTVTAGGTAQADGELTAGAIRVQDVVVTGVARGIPKVKLPFTVDKVDIADIPVPPVSAEGWLVGKVAGVKVQSTSGDPGSTSQIMLRAASSISGSETPLIIVDNVITTSSFDDIAALDIESFEIVKGAAGASMYGSRAANGVIQIFTKRGTGFGGRDYNRVQFRQETGLDQQVGRIPLSQNHPWKTDSEGYLVSVQGNRIEGLTNNIPRSRIENPDLNGESVSTSFADGDWPWHLDGWTKYDHIDRIFEDGWLITNYGVVEGRDGGTNYRTSFEHHRDMGLFPQFFDGFGRKGFRMNLDNNVRDGLAMNFSAVYTQNRRDFDNVSFYSLTFMGPYVDLLERDPCTGTAPANENLCSELERNWTPSEACPVEGCLYIEPDALAQASNPLYFAEITDPQSFNSDLKAAVNSRWNPTAWSDIEAVFAVDRNFYNYQYVSPADIPYNPEDGDQPSVGYTSRSNSRRQAVNAEVTASVSRAFGDLNTRTRARYLQRTQDYYYFYGSGADFIASGVPQLQNTDPDSHYVSSSEITTREEGYFLITGLDYLGKYIFDGVVRRDGSSLFGASQRWQTYYRTSLAYRPSMESWWPVPDQVNEFKVHWSLGTAGRRPGFYDQYETYSVSSAAIRPVRQGNKDIRPQRSTENEVGVNMVLFNRITTSLVYAFKTDVDQILSVPLARSRGGFSFQTQNAGTLESNTWEYTVEAPILATEDFSYNVRVNLDRSRSEITELNRPPYRTGTRYVREGEIYGAHYGVKWAKSCTDLPAGTDCSQFQVNDDGLMVWVGSGNYTDGIAQGLWGTNSEGMTGQDIFDWGMPIRTYGQNFTRDVECVERRQGATGCTDFVYLGNTMPDLNFSMTHTFRWRGLSLYALFDGELGVDVYNGTRQWAYRDNRSGDMDQGGKADSHKKPVKYYQLLYNTNADNDWFIEKSDYLKLRELSLRYSINPEWLDAIFAGRVQGAEVNLIGRNVYTLTGYSGFDPEVGGIISRVDSYQYPNPRRVSMSVQFTF
ncbi:MAG: SusC/RagA family TonB-linked outer membrane protein [Gemmatimonadetes bacterium]|nr:SusC/RagA family TonB-linked outer membrane protein [Gemmatimonadota bacterium]MYE68756.1 SusC/RagA family TonB-linked outer membrane protein [Gemmatimonadota bacterium]MYJ69884.1 SusC/RagA family TonB-linked outer membrane protein [Gemmatimonadota bacterium]